MADILIKNIEKPFPNACLELHDGGSHKIIKKYEAIEIPPHGNLKDELDILRIFDKYLPKVDDDTNALLCEIIAEIHLQAPTVLEASNGSDN